MPLRSTTIDLFAPDEQQRQSVRNSIRRYRHVCREAYAALLLGQVAGAEITDGDDGPSLKPNYDAGKLALAAATGAARIERGERVKGDGQAFAVKIGSKFAYELRPYIQQLLPTALSFVGDSIRRDVVTVWKSGDPEHPTASRGWLAMQGARGVAQFQRRGIGIPVATGRPRLAAHSLTLKWDHEIGPVEFKVPTLDPGAWRVWRSLQDGTPGWSLGTIYLTERDGQIKAVLSHHRPDDLRDVDAGRVCSVTFGEVGKTWLTMTGPDAVQAISSAAVTAALDEHVRQRTRLERRRKACGSSIRSWGHRRAWAANQDVLSTATRQRARLVQDYNHAFSRRIVTRAISWRCGTLVLGPLPELIGVHPWQWSQFKDMLRYKASERGSALVIT